LSVPCEWRVAGEGGWWALSRNWRSGGGVFKNEKYLRGLLCESCGYMRLCGEARLLMPISFFS